MSKNDTRWLGNTQKIETRRKCYERHTSVTSRMHDSGLSRLARETHAPAGCILTIHHYDTHVDHRASRTTVTFNASLYVAPIFENRILDEPCSELRTVLETIEISRFKLDEKKRSLSKKLRK